MRIKLSKDMPVGKKIKTLAEIIKELSEKLLKEVVKDGDTGKNQTISK